ncbi:hypothetical protein [Yinghuangia soli]|uniref:Uncharacterized protein n=1 Tax=Yinghuangia soli TaxID=2908204 RepID=A0AA41U198_9ACTN|nr:hypothetical protein [Yinghuangia soli]MCF2529335.1 hypothetical protein [Yinghuangia soli]
MRKLMARVALRSALAISAVGIVAAAGAFDGGPAKDTRNTPAQTVAAQPAGWHADTADAGTRAGQAAADAQSASSSYTLRTENGPRAALAARIVTATLLLTGLVLTGLGAIGMRGPSLSRGRRDVPVPMVPAYAPARIPRPGGHPRFGPPPT